MIHSSKDCASHPSDLVSGPGLTIVSENDNVLLLVELTSNGYAGGEPVSEEVANSIQFTRWSLHRGKSPRGGAQREQAVSGQQRPLRGAFAMRELNEKQEPHTEAKASTFQAGRTLARRH